jgi:hypothetical protein
MMLLMPTANLPPPKPSSFDRVAKRWHETFGSPLPKEEALPPQPQPPRLAFRVPSYVWKLIICGALMALAMMKQH